MTFKYSILARVNQGVIQSLFSLTSVFLIIIGRIVFHERMRLIHYVGISMMIVCSLLISFSDDNSKAKKFEVMGEEVDKVSSLYPVIFAILCPLSFAVGSIIVRIVHIKFSIAATDFKLMTNLWSSIIMVLYCLTFAVPTSSTIKI